jgi:DNA repair exonuclease SbcCD nuclease subunit
MKYAILGDTHFGCRNDSQHFHDNFAKFYQETFFATIVKLGIRDIIQTGDLFDRRKFINFQSLNRAREYFFHSLYDQNMHMITYIGNHDCYYKNTLQINSPRLLLSDYKNYITIIDKPTTIDGMDFFPWICADNQAETNKLIAESRSQIAFGHFELTGFEMDAGVPCIHGMNRDELKKYDMVISGHFHHRSSDGHIFYVGSPYEMTWADFDDPRGFHIFDTETRTLEFIENPHKMFYKVAYDDTNENINTIDAKDYAEFKDKYVKVVVKKKNSHMLFDRFINNFYEHEPADLNIVEDFTDYKVAETLTDNVDQAEQTHVLLEKYVDAVDMALDKTKMKSVMRQIYDKAQNGSL